MSIDNYLFLTIVFAVGVFALYRLFEMNKEYRNALNKENGGKKYFPSEIDGFDRYAMPLVLIILCYSFAEIFILYPEKRYIFPLMLVITAISYLSGKSLGERKGINKAFMLLMKEHKDKEKD